MIKKYSVNIFGHKTSVSLEPVFWETLQHIVKERGISLGAMFREIDATRTDPNQNLSSLIRVYIFHYLKNRSDV